MNLPSYSTLKSSILHIKGSGISETSFFYQSAQRYILEHTNI
jgi:hypothetical protein